MWIEKFMKKNNRTFLVESFIGSMVGGNSIVQKKSDLSISDLNGKTLYYSIGNKALLGTLKDMGFKLEPLSGGGRKFKAVAGDIIYAIKPSASILPYKEDERLPQDITLSLEMYSVREGD